MRDKYKNKILIDTQELHKKVMYVITTEYEFDKYFKSTVFAEKEDSSSYRSAMIYGMCIATMLSSCCDPVLVSEKE